MRFYLVDRVTNLKIGDSIEGTKCWSLSDDFFNEHFPGSPKVPGVLVIESMAQLLGVLTEKSHFQEYKDEKGIYVILSMIHKAKFRDFLKPGDKCEIKGNIKTMDLNRCTASGKVWVDGNLMVEADLTFLIFSQDVVKENKFLERREEYMHILLSGINED